MRFLHLILMTGLCVMTPALAQQQPAAPPSEGHHSSDASSTASVDEHIKMLSDKLSLTADQIAKIKPLFADQFTQMQAVRKDSSLSAGQKLDKIRSIHDETHAKIRDVLTEDQQKKFDAMGSQMREHMRRNPGGEGDNPPPPK